MTDDVRTIEYVEPTDRHREIPPNADGYRIKSGGSIVGEIAVSSGNELTFHWYQTQSSWPSAFDLIDDTTAGTVAQSDKFEHSTFNATATSFNRGTCQWRIEQGGDVIGYLYKASGKLVWYATDLAPSESYFALGELNFVANTDTGTDTARDATDFSL